MLETQVQSLGLEDPLEKEMATHSNTLAWKIPQMKEHHRLQSMGLQSRTQRSKFTLTSLYLFSWLLFSIILNVLTRATRWEKKWNYPNQRWRIYKIVSFCRWHSLMYRKPWRVSQKTKIHNSDINALLTSSQPTQEASRVQADNLLTSSDSWGLPGLQPLLRGSWGVNTSTPLSFVGLFQLCFTESPRESTVVVRAICSLQ